MSSRENRTSGKPGSSTHWFANDICMDFNDLISGEIPKPLVKKINEGKRIPVQKYKQAAILVVYGIFKFSNSLLWLLIL